jgi:hypothetical protein
MNLRIHIDRLVLHGLPVSRASGALVQANVEAELARLFVEGGLAPGLLSAGAIPSVTGGAISLAASDRPVMLGQKIAQAVYGGITS